MSEITPDDISQRSFGSSFRGFSPEEVRSFLREVSQTIEALTSERDQLRVQLGTTSGSEMRAELEQVGKEVATVLESARRAAEAMRERAGAESARWRSEAIAECETELRQARADAEQLRSDAWSTAEELLRQSERESSHLVDEAKANGLRLQGESEREAHKVTSSARRQADELIRNARMESERLIVSAQAKHDEIIETANRLSETAQERTRALEQRRDELKEELDTVRQAMASMEGAMDERREAMGLSSGPESEREGPSIAEDWAPGETVRVVRPEGAADSTPPASAPVTPLPMSVDIKVIPASELADRAEGEEPAVAEESGVEQPGPEATAPETVVPEVRESEAPPGSESTEPSTEAETAASEESFDELTGLFDKLRHAGEPEETEHAGSDDEAEDVSPLNEEPDGDADVGASREVIEPEPSETRADETSSTSADQDPPFELDLDPFELRDQLLLPVSNRALRNLKRQLAEEGNLALEELHLDPENWMPETDEIRGKVRADLVVLHAESFGAGHAAVERLTGARLTRPPTPKAEVAAEFATDLTTDLEHTLEEGRHSGQGALQLKAGVSRVFRAWRTDESERRMRGMSIEAFNAGVLATVDQNEMPGVRWVLSGRGCAVCRSSAGETDRENTPPAHDGCECVIVPV